MSQGAHFCMYITMRYTQLASARKSRVKTLAVHGYFLIRRDFQGQDKGTLGIEIAGQLQLCL